MFTRSQYTRFARRTIMNTALLKTIAIGLISTGIFGLALRIGIQAEHEALTGQQAMH
jgi:hypothetical protein